MWTAGVPWGRVNLGSWDSGMPEQKEALPSSEQDTLALVLAGLRHHVTLGFCFPFSQ